jgi:hypothetical protein
MVSCGGPTDERFRSPESMEIRCLPMSPRNKKAGIRRLVDMAADVAEAGWSPDLPPVQESRDTYPISDTTSYVVRCAYDEHSQLVDWAVVQRRTKQKVS